MRADVIEKCLDPVMKDVIYFTRGFRFAIVVRFKSAEKARELSDKALKTEEVVLLPSYLGRCKSRIRIEEVASQSVDYGGSVQ